MKSKLAPLFPMLLFKICHLACSQTGHPTCLSPMEDEALKIAQRELQVLPVFASARVSGFPISKRNAVTAAHVLYEGCSVVAVRGMPMHAVLASASYLRSLPPEWDWVTLHANRDLFLPNRIDGTVELAQGDLVFVGGYRQESPKLPTTPDDGLRHALKRPEIVAGRVHNPIRSGGGPSIIEVAVPPGDYAGFSGGPAAILDQEAELRVWGVAIEQQWVHDISAFRGKRFVLVIARLPEEVIDEIQYSDSPALPQRIHSSRQAQVEER